MSASLPSLFLSHGAPDLPLTNHPAKAFLTGLEKRLPRPSAILVVSAHWETPGLALGSAPTPETVYDFAGFPSVLRQMRYPAQTSFALLDRVEALLRAAGRRVTRDPSHGYDHGVWAPLMLSFPRADIPLAQLSLDLGGDAARHVEIGRALAPLRAEGVLTIGSGAAVHNLRALKPEGSPPPPWAQRFDVWLAEAIAARDLAALTAFSHPAAADAALAHPTPEHLHPLHVALGAGWSGGASRRIHQSFSYGSISMAAYAFGAPPELGAFDAPTAA